MHDVDFTIIGAGVVGLAIAHELSSHGEVLVIEQDAAPGRGVSSRSSEVIHAGIYFPTHFLKTRLCVQGNPLLYAFCRRYQVPHQRIGKVIVAVNPGETASLEKLGLLGRENGVQGLRFIEKSELKQLEPHVKGICALVSPDTGIVDSHQLVKRLEALTLANGSSLLCHTALVGLDQCKGGFTCHVRQHGTPYCFSSRVVINAAGLLSDTVAAMAGIDIDAAGYRIHPVKGEYFRVGARAASRINGLVYPSPEKDLTGLGIHATKDLGGGMKLGPNAFYVDGVDYSVDSAHKQAFFENIHELLPFLCPDDLEPDMAGIRPKTQAKGAPAKDFIIAHEMGRGLPGLVNLVGIESPGLTACLAIGRMVADMLADAGLVKRR